MKQVPGVCVFHALATGLHWRIHRSVRIILLIIRTAIVAWIGLIKRFSTGICRRKKQIDILVNIRVWKVCIHSPYEYF